MSMRRRFTGKARVSRGSIPKRLRQEIFRRDMYKCQFCQGEFSASELTIDHLVPLALGGLDEMINYVTCCRTCNSQKAAQPLSEFARELNVRIEKLPVHGDPVLVPSPRSFGTSLRNGLNSGAILGEVVSEHDSEQVQS